MKSGNGDTGFMSEINVTPLVDVMLVLLIIFMVAAPMMVQGLDVALPQVTAQPLDTREDQLMVTVRQDSRIYINDFEVSLEELEGKLALIIQGRAAPELYLKADREVPYGLVAQVMGRIKDAGVDKLGMVTEPAPPEQDVKPSRPRRG
jgi:biopolymer transport protein TolR